MVSIDIYLNETTRHADLILPGSSPLEDLHYDIVFQQFSHRNHARFSEPVLARVNDNPPEWQILLRLVAIAAGRGTQIDVNQFDTELFAAELQRNLPAQADALLGALAHLSGPERQIEFSIRTGPYGDRFGQNTDGINLAKIKAAPGGIDLGPMQPRIPELLRTPSGKIELAPAMLIDDLRRPASALKEAAPELVIVGRRQVRSGNSWMHNLPILAKGPYRCTALVNPFDVQRLGLQDGGMARVQNGDRSIEVQVETSDEMMPGVVSLPHGWGHDLTGVRMAVATERPGANLNVLLDDALRDPLSGNAVLSGIAIEMRPVQG